MPSIWFTGNHEDLSTDRGYQFKFYCEKCGNGYMSTFKASAIDWTKQRDVATVIGALCPACGAKTQGGEFCPECGVAVAAKKHCNKCGADAEGNPKFCPECGQKYA